MKNRIGCAFLSTVFLLACHTPEPAPNTALQPAQTMQPVAAKTAAHPSEDIQVSGLLGMLSDEEIGEPFHEQWNEIVQCYETVKNRSHLWYLGGRVELKFRVGASGNTETAFVVSSSMGNYEAEHCIVAVAQKLHFAAPHGGAVAEFTYPIDFRSHAAVRSWEPQRAVPPIQTQKRRRDVAECRQRGKAAMPPQLSLTLYVVPGGRVASAGLAADAPIDDQLALCLISKTQHWRFEDPLGAIAKTTFGVEH